MTLEEYGTFSDDVAQKAGVKGGVHGYFLGHRNRLWRTACHFDLWSLRNREILEIGPFFSYTPFVLKKQGNNVTVLEGEDPAVYPLKPVYESQGINFSTCDLFESFGSPLKERHALPFAENQFDLISCWETMEHFNFNPVGFIRDLYRVLKPGGEVFITVPNLVKLENRIKPLFGKSTGNPVETYNQFYNYSNGRFLGFHWREYVLSELTYLFSTQNFSIVSAKHLLTFHNHQSRSALVKIRRMLYKPVFSLVPSTGNLCAIIARKPHSNGK